MLPPRAQSVSSWHPKPRTSSISHTCIPLLWNGLFLDWQETPVAIHWIMNIKPCSKNYVPPPIEGIREVALLDPRTSNKDCISMWASEELQKSCELPRAGGQVAPSKCPSLYMNRYMNEEMIHIYIYIYTHVTNLSICLPTYTYLSIYLSM